MKTVRIGIIGIGNAGSLHAQTLRSGLVPGAELAACCDSPERLALAEEKLGAETVRFDSLRDMLASDLCNAVVVATPHKFHPRQVMAALSAGCHVFCEKPAGVSIDEVRAMNAAAEKTGLVFTMNFNRRTEPVFRRAKEMVAGGGLGRIFRISWTCTHWYRPQSYYDSCGWRGTWAGEGGGVLVNQCPHELDLWQWMFSLPVRVRAHCGFGRYHDLEVEDDVTAYMEYASGATGVFIASTGEAPGTNRLEIAADRGRLVVEDGTMHFDRTDSSVSEFTRGNPSGFGRPRAVSQPIETPGAADLEAGILRNFVQAIRGEGELLVPGTDGLASIELSSAMLLSAWTDSWAELPVDEAAFRTEFDRRVAASRGTDGGSGQLLDLKDSFQQ